MMEPLSLRKRSLYLSGFVILFILLVPIVVLYSSGYRLGKDFSLEKTGGIYVSTNEAGVSIYVDRNLERETNAFQRSIYVSNLKPGTYFVKVLKDGRYPWVKAVQVLPQQVSQSFPFLAPVNPELTQVATSSASSTLALFKTKPLSDTAPYATSTSSGTASTTIYSLHSRDITVWKEGNAIMAEWIGPTSEIPFYFCDETLQASTCVNKVKVYETKELGAIFFYPGRNDVFLFADHAGISAVELDMRQPQNIVPLVMGEKLDLRVIDGEDLFVKKGSTIYKVEL